MSRTLRVILMSAVLALFAGRASAQCNSTGFPSSCAQTRAWSVVVQPTVRVTVTPTVATLASPDATDFTNGFSISLGHTAVIKANNAWQLLISSGQALWTAGGGGRPNKPDGDLLWGLSSGGPFTAVTGTPVQVTTGTATNATSVSIYYKVLWVWNLDIPGTYTLPVTLTISAP
jgi:hypothetical protein